MTGTPSTTVNEEAFVCAPPVTDSVWEAEWLCGESSLNTMPSDGRYPHTTPSASTTALPPAPSRIWGSAVAGDTDSTSSDGPAHTSPVFVLRKAMVPPPIIDVLSPFVSVVESMPTVDALIVDALPASASTVAASCWATSNRCADDETPASACLSFTLSRAALRSLSDVTHTEPSSSWTCRCVTELMMIAPATTPRISSRVTTGVIHLRFPDGTRRRSSAPVLRDRSYDWEDCLAMLSLPSFPRPRSGPLRTPNVTPAYGLR